METPTKTLLKVRVPVDAAEQDIEVLREQLDGVLKTYPTDESDYAKVMEALTELEIVLISLAVKTGQMEALKKYLQNRK